jgi:hypothetical protein
MRKNLRQLIVLVSILSLCFNKTTAQTSTNELTDKFFGIYATELL